MLIAALWCMTWLAADVEDTLAEGSVHYQALHGDIEDPPPPPPSTKRLESIVPLKKSGMVQGYLKAGQTSAAVPRWDLLTHVIWFGVTMNTSGTVANSGGIGDSNYLGIVKAAHEHGVEVLIAAILFNTTAKPDNVAIGIANKATLIPTLVDLMVQHDADGISLDYEVVPESSKQAYVDLLHDLSIAAKAARPGAHITSAIPPPTGWKGYDYVGIANNSDSAFIMAYDYNYLGGGMAGPVTPKNDGTAWGSLNYTQSLNAFSSTLSAEQKLKMVIGLPWYGYNWPTKTSGLFAGVDKTRTKKPFAQTFAAGHSLLEGPSGLFDNLSEQPWASYDDGGFRQLWLDDAASFGAKTQLIVDGAFGGLGLFALAYEGSDPRMWAEIEARYSKVDESPVAVIEVASQVSVGKSLVADGSGSRDADGDALTYAWTCDACDVLNPTSSSTNLTFPVVGTVSLSLTVTAASLSHTTSTTITVSKGKNSTGSGTTGGSGVTGGNTGETTGGNRPVNYDISGTRASAERSTGCRSTAAPEWAFVVLGAVAGAFRRGGTGRGSRSGVRLGRRC